MKLSKLTLLAVLAALMGVFALGGCTPEESTDADATVENAAEAGENAMEETEGAVDDATDAAGDAVENAGDAAGDAMDKVGEGEGDATPAEGSGDDSHDHDGDGTADH